MLCQSSNNGSTLDCGIILMVIVWYLFLLVAIKIYHIQYSSRGIQVRLHWLEELENKVTKVCINPDEKRMIQTLY